MSNTRPVLRTAAAAAAAPLFRPARQRRFRNPLQQRFRSDQPGRPSSYDENARSFNPAAVGGIAGGVTAFAACYAWYHFSGTKNLVKGTHENKKYLDSVQTRLHQSSPDPDQTLKWLRQTATSYAAFVPGASRVVNSAFDELDTVHASHRKQVDNIVTECYEDLRQLGQRGLDLDTARQGWQIVLRHLRRVHDLAGNALTEALDRHPEVRDKLGGSVDLLRAASDNLGPEARQIVEQAWRQASDIVRSSGGDATAFSEANVARVQKTLDDAAERLAVLADDAWRRAMRQAKPHLDMLPPEIRALVERNADALSRTDAQELLRKIKGAATTADATELREYVRNAVRRAGGKSGSILQDYLDEQILPGLGEVRDAAERHGKEAEGLLRSTVAEVAQVLSRKAEEARKIGERARADAEAAAGQRRPSSSSSSSSSSPGSDSQQQQQQQQQQAPPPPSRPASSWFGWK